MGTFKSFSFTSAFVDCSKKVSIMFMFVSITVAAWKVTNQIKSKKTVKEIPIPPKKIAKKYLHWWENLIYKHLNVQENHIGAKYTDINSIKMVNVALRRDTVGKIGDKKKTNFPKTKEGVPYFFVFLFKF